MKRKRAVGWVSGFAVAMLVACGVTAAVAGDAAGSLRFRIFDNTNGKPIAGAVVDVSPPGGATTRTLTSDADGRIAIAGLTPGEYRATIRASGRVPLSSTPIRLTDGGVIEQAVGMLPGETLSGRVVNADGKPIGTAQVCAAPFLSIARAPQTGLAFAPITASGALVCATSAADGAAALPPLPSGAYRLTVRAPGFSPVENARVDLASGARPATWALSPAGALAARLVDASGRGVADAKLVLKDRLRGRTVQISTDASGAVRVEGLAAGYWRLEIEPAEHLALVRDNVSVEPGQTTDLGTLHARPAASLDARFVGPDGKAVAAAEVRVQESSAAKRILRVATTDENGRVHVGGLPAGAVVDVLVRPKATWAARSFESVRLPLADGAFTLEPSVRLTGRAVPEAGSVLPHGSRVVVWPRAGNPSFDATGGLAATAPVDLATGAFTVEGVPPGGPVEVRLYAPGLGEAAATVSVDDGKDASGVELRPQKSAYVLRGRVIDAAGRPVAGARLATATTDAEGRFTIEGLAPGPNRLVVTHPSYAPLAHTFPASPEEDAVLVLDEGGILEGAVTDARGRPVVGARIATESVGVSAETGAGGRYRIEHVPTGLVGVDRQAATTGGDVERRKVAVSAGEVRSLDFRIGAGSVEGVVVRGGEPVSGATVSIRQTPEKDAGPDPTELLVQSTTSDEEGRYRVVSLRPGAGVATVNDGKQSLTLPIQVDESGVARVDVDLPLRPLEGVVLDASGKPLAGACVASGVLRLASPGSGGDDAYARTSTDGQGRFVLLTDEDDPKVVTVCTCAQGCHDVSVDPSSDGVATLWFAPK